MSTPRINYGPRLTQHLAHTGRFGDDPFFVVDVGASGGIESHWSLFGDALRAVGFDPLIKECERLNGDAPEGVEYRPYFIGAEGDRGIADAEKAPTLVNPFDRSSALRAEKEAEIDFVKEYFNRGDEVVYTKNRASLDTLFLGADHTVDFVKVDTDGHDYEVLRGARKMLVEKQVLGLLIECQFHGPRHEHANVFRNIDRLMAETGFSLFDIDVHRYSRGLLPGKFVYRFPAQTHIGQVTWGDALYLVDIASDGFEAMYGRTLPPLKILKLACLNEIYGLPDCAAEILDKYRDQLAPLLDVDEGLDLLAKNLDANASFAAYTERFTSERSTFHPETPLCSLILRVENGMPHLPAAIDSIRKQSYRNFELIIQDGASTDGTLAFLQDSANLDQIPKVLLESSPHQSIGSSLNQALARCSGDIIGTMDANTLLSPNALESAVREFIEHPSAAVIYGDQEVIDADADRQYTESSAAYELEAVLTNDLVIPLATTFFSRAKCGERLRFDESLTEAPEFDLWLRLTGLGAEHLHETLASTRALTRPTSTYRQACTDKIAALDRFLAQRTDLAENRDRYVDGIYAEALRAARKVAADRTEIRELALDARRATPKLSRVAATLSTSYPHLQSIFTNVDEGAIRQDLGLPDTASDAAFPEDGETAAMESHRRATLDPYFRDGATVFASDGDDIAKHWYYTAATEQPRDAIFEARDGTAVWHGDGPSASLFTDHVDHPQEGQPWFRLSLALAAPGAPAQLALQDENYDVLVKFDFGDLYEIADAERVAVLYFRAPTVGKQVRLHVTMDQPGQLPLPKHIELLQLVAQSATSAAE